MIYAPTQLKAWIPCWFLIYGEPELHYVDAYIYYNITEYDDDEYLGY